MILFAHINTFYTAAGEEKESDRSEQNHKRKSNNNDIQNQKRSKSFRDDVIDNFKTNFAPLRQGFDLLGFNYDEFLETQRDFIPENGDGYECEDNDFMKKIITNAENIIIERMQTILEQGFKQAIKNTSDIDIVTRQIFDYATYYEVFSRPTILRYLINIPDILIDAVRGNNLAVVNLLIAAGVDVNDRESPGSTTVSYAAQEGYVEIVQVLIEAEADINNPDEKGWTPLMYAAFKDREEIVQILIAAKADIDLQDGDGYTALMHAAREDNSEIVQILIAAEADVDLQDEDGYTALMNAAQKDNSETVQILIAAGANIDLQSNEDETAFDLAGEDMQLIITEAIAQREAAQLEAAHFDSFELDL